jgi:hypothetical protein
MCALLRSERAFIISYRSLERSIFPLPNFSIAMVNLLEEDVNTPISPSTSKLLVLTLLLGLVAEDDACCSSFTTLGITLPSVEVVGTLCHSSSTASVPR